MKHSAAPEALRATRETTFSGCIKQNSQYAARPRRLPTAVSVLRLGNDCVRHHKHSNAY